jgi:LAO/AO transport system kinase
MLQLAPERNGWEIPVVRTVATENKGVGELASTIQRFRQHFDQTAKRQDKQVDQWKRRLAALAENQFLARALDGADGEAALETLAREVTARRKDPYTAVRELMSRAGL